jgi:hypothetical protein
MQIQNTKLQKKKTHVEALCACVRIAPSTFRKMAADVNRHVMGDIALFRHPCTKRVKA